MRAGRSEEMFVLVSPKKKAFESPIYLIKRVSYTQMNSNSERGDSSSAQIDTDRIISELRTSNRLLAIMACRGMQQKDAILLLEAAGFKPTQIASVLSISPNAVRISLHRMRREMHTRSGASADSDGHVER